MYIEDVSDDAKWYVVHTYSGYENKVKANLERVIENRGMQEYFQEIIIPMMEEVEIKEGREKSTLKKVFPGYVLVKMILTDDTCSAILATSALEIVATLSRLGLPDPLSILQAFLSKTAAGGVFVMKENVLSA